MARRPRGQGPRARDAPPKDLHLQRRGSRGRGPRLQRGVLHELPPDSRDASWRVEGMPEPERRSHPDPRPRRRWSARGVPTGRREPCAVLRGVRQRVPAARSAWRRADRIPGSPGGLSLRSESSNSPAGCVAIVKVFRGLDVIAAEYKATDQVPTEARKFTGWDQFTLWFAAASLPAAWLYGGYMTGAYGLPGAFALIFLASTITFIPWALIGYIAADKGASSVSLLRPAFGLRGSKLPSVFYLFFGYGWAAVNVFIAAISMSFVFNLTLGWPDAFHTPAGSPINYYLVPSILLICFLQGLFATAGHRAIRYLNWASTVALVGLGAYASYIVLKDFDFGQLWAWRPTRPLSFTFTAGALGNGFTYTLTLPLLLDLLIAYNWTWEFIGDFSRFARSKRAGTWGPFAGASRSRSSRCSRRTLCSPTFFSSTSSGRLSCLCGPSPSSITSS